jgi:branched-chain amino acid transport system substrate-binding protein
MKKIYIVIAIIILIGVGIALSNNSAEQTKIGVILPATGILAEYGEQVRAGVLAAGSEEQFIFEDDQCDPKFAVSAFQKLVSVDRVSVIVGPECGSPQEAIAPLAKEQDVVVILPAAASRTLYTQSDGKMYNVQYALEDESKFLADEMYKQGHRTVLAIGYQNAFSAVHMQSFKNNFKGTIVREISIADANADVFAELTKVKGMQFDAIYSNDIAFYLNNGMEKLQRLGMNQPVYSQYAVELPAVRPLVEGVIYSFPGNIRDDQGAVKNLSHEAAEIAVAAAKKCGTDTACIKDYLNTSGKFDQTGISNRDIVLKTIKNGAPELLNN